MSKEVNNIDPQLSSTSADSFHHMANQESRFPPVLENGQGCRVENTDLETELKENSRP